MNRDLTTVAQVQSLLGIPATQDSGLLQRLVTAASLFALSFMCREIKAKAYTNESYDGTGSDRLPVRAVPILSVQSLRVYDGMAPIDVPAAATPANYGYQFDENLLFMMGGGLFNRGRRNVVVSYTGGFEDTTITDEPVNVPGEAPLTATLLQGTLLRELTSLKYAQSGTSLVRVAANPAPGQFTLSASMELGFNAQDKARNLLATYTVNGTPLDLMQAVTEMAATRYRKKDRLDIRSKTLAQEVIQFEMSDVGKMPASVLGFYQRAFSP